MRLSSLRLRNKEAVVLRYLIAILMISVFHLVAIALSAISGEEYGLMLASLAIGAISVLAVDNYLTKEGD